MYNFNKNKLRGYLEFAISIILVLSSVYSFVIAPHVVCIFEECKSTRITTIFTIFPRSVALGCLASRITIMYKNTNAFKKYEKKIQEYGVHYPLSRDKEAFRRNLIVFIVAVYAAAILPINAYRILWIHDTFHSKRLIVFFSLMYVQNMTVCIAELQFFNQCVGLYQRFQIINDEMSLLKSETIVTNKYPLVLKADERNGDHRAGGDATPVSDGCSSIIKACPLVDVIEQLKLRHKCISNAIRKLNELYGLQLGLSLCVLFLMILSDVYELLSKVHTKTRERVFYYAWLFQYSFRFCMIVTITHGTTKEIFNKLFFIIILLEYFFHTTTCGHNVSQAQKSKKIITDINNRSIDNNAKEELQLFLNELSSRSVDFTTYDLFVINIHLIISAIVTGTTYLVILFQFH